ncbi:hypothetical protein [Haloarchaeobius sp. FL176]|uniref:hypothetical protein n=1 Tax=Haloarchaeobius sp. FL176 TaxID=2967129 RepID=UPI0021494F96|nr:hypothetical protein [Haloarchaeobius sp. FL176]
MPAFGLGALVLPVVQLLVSTFVYSEAKTYGSRSPVLAGAAVFVLGIGLVLVLGAVVEPLAVELLVVLAYSIGLRTGSRRSSSV